MTLLVTQTDEVLVLTLNRPECRNALSRELLTAVKTELVQAAAGGASAVVLTGGDVCFSAGADFRELDGTVADLAFDDLMAEVVNAIRQAPFVVVAAIEGACIGAGLDLAMACDIRVVSVSALFQLPAVKMGILYNPAAILRLVNALPSATIRRLLLLGERVGGEQAIAAGLASHAAAKGNTLATALDIARNVSHARPRALVETKRLLTAAENGSVDVTSWQSIRMSLLASAERATAVGSAKARQRQ